MGCKKLTYHETLSPLKVVCNDLNVNGNTCLGSYRYGFSSMEKDDEVKGSGNHYSFSDYGYDPRTGRRWQVDPEAARGPQYSPYSFAFNNPILYVDEDGKWAVYVHYKMTKQALMKAGISKQTAKQIAHYASTYADNPSGGVRFLNQVLGVAAGVNPFALSKNEKKYGAYDLDSQNDGLVKSVSIHAMKTYWEGISDDEAVNRALHGGEFEQKDEDGTVTGTIVIEGALNVIERYKGVAEKDLTKADKKAIGVAMHTIQDADAHTGGKWAQGKKHTEHAKEMGSPKRHSLFRDVFGNKSKSKDDSKKAAETLKGGS